MTVSIVGWLVLNACNMDRLMANYNVALYQRQEISAIDLSYLVNELSYDALDALGQIPMKTVGFEQAIQARRARAAWNASHWQTWNLSAWLAARQ